MKRAALTGALLLAVAVAVGAAPGDGAPPATIVSPSAAGEVTFPHAMHVEELGIACEECHHETGAARLAMPHEEYFKDFWIDCTTCHGNGRQATATPQPCGGCHHASPADAADETLSAKVVIHRSCGACHPLGTGVEASESCGFCHTGAKGERR